MYMSKLKITFRTQAETCHNCSNMWVAIAEKVYRVRGHRLKVKVVTG